MWAVWDKPLTSPRFSSLQVFVDGLDILQKTEEGSPGKSEAMKWLSIFSCHRIGEPSRMNENRVPFCRMAGTRQNRG
jgi:hypothetical protein